MPYNKIRQSNSKERNQYLLQKEDGSFLKKVNGHSGITGRTLLAWFCDGISRISWPLLSDSQHTDGESQAVQGVDWKVRMTSIERHEARYQRRKAKREAIRAKRHAQYGDYDKIYTYDHLYHSYRMCRKEVRWKASTQKYIANATLNVYNTYKELHNGKFKSKGFYEFDVFERGKRRHIRSVDIHERVVQRCTCDYSLIPMLQPTFIYDNGASMKNKGYSFAVRRFNRQLQKHIRKHGNKGYVLLFDFSSYFDSIPHELLYNILEKLYHDERTLNLIKHFISMFGEKGIGLGSQVSQVLALAAANALDHYIKEELRIKCYGRYMDDGSIIHESKEYLMECMEKIRAKCESLGLKLSEKKTRIIPISRDFTWLKIRYRVTETGHIVKRIWRKSVVRMRRKLRKLKAKMGEGLITAFDIAQSIQAWKSHTHGLAIYQTMKRMDELIWNLFGTEVIA